MAGAAVAVWSSAPRFLIAALLAGCGPSERLPDERELPYVEATAAVHPYPLTAGDLDGDGEDEIVYTYAPTQSMPDRFMAVVLLRHTGETIEQVNIPGVLRPPVILDLYHDGLPEVLVPVVRSDSLFVSILSGTGAKLGSFFVASGKPRIEPEGELPWDPHLAAAFVEDADGDGVDELILVVFTGYGRLPRGVYVHSLPDGRLEGSALVGAAVLQPLLGDFDDDGRPEIAAGSMATNNGAAAGGYDDSKAYLLEFDLGTDPHVARSLELPTGGVGRVEHADFDGDGTRELLVSSTGFSGLGSRGYFLMLDARDWHRLRERTIDESIAQPVLVDLDRDTKPEIAVLAGSRELWILDGRFELLRRRRLPGTPVRLQKVADLSGGGSAELAVQYVDGTLLLDDALRVIARLDGGGVAGIVRRALGTPPLLIVQTSETTASLSRLQRNPAYLFHRYGPAAAAFSALVAVLLLGAAFLRESRENRRMRAAHAAVGTMPSPTLLVDRAGRIRWAGGVLAGGTAPTRPAPRIPPLAEIERAAPGITAVVRSLRVRSGRRRRGVPEVSPGFRIEPIVAGIHGDPHWIVRVDAAAPEEATRHWTLMAQRVAHGLKNPLTSMLLTLRRLEMEYRERAPGVASRLDRYSSRLEQRIEELRRLTSNFLKFVDVEAPELTLTDPNDVVREHGTALERTLPPDIRLEVRCRPGIPAVPLDRDQLHAALDNLVANAVNAMPDGGLITLGTDLANGIQWTVEGMPCDYVTIEVADTGTGIPDALKPHVFEPGRSGREDGSGLGLAIVRKIAGDHGGHVTFESEVGSGTAFTIYLPAESATQHRRGPAKEVTAAGP